MSVIADIIKTIRRLRCMPDLDIERLSYYLNDDEWRELGQELNKWNPSDLDISYADQCMFMGMTIRKRPVQITAK